MSTALQRLCMALPCAIACLLCSVRAPAQDWWAPGETRVLEREQVYANTAGTVTTLNAAGPTPTSEHPFFAALGTNGRACVTCHQPADGMSLSLLTIKARWQASAGKDPLFAAVDGANCPDLPQADAASHSLLLEHGLFRIARPWPPQLPDGKRAQFTLQVLRDPTGCNLDARYGLAAARPMVSVYRRPRPAANLKYATAVGFPFEPKTGLPLPTDVETGQLISGNLLSDARASSLPAQVREALRTHLELPGTADASKVRSIVELIEQLYTAQSTHVVGGSLSEAGAQGGPQTLLQARAGELQSASTPIWEEFLPWLTASGGSAPQLEFRRSVARGAELFAKRTFLVSDSSGMNNMGFGNPVRNSCAFCHNMRRTGLDVAPGQIDIGSVNAPRADPAPHLPLFKLVCDPKYPAHPFLGRVVYTQDPGYALTTGKCADIGKITVQSMRGLAARAPYFVNGAAATLRQIVDFYERRYNIGLSEQDKQDLTNLMSVL